MNLECDSRFSTYAKKQHVLQTQRHSQALKQNIQLLAKTFDSSAIFGASGHLQPSLYIHILVYGIW